jgi:uncharacterized membrane protein
VNLLNYLLSRGQLLPLASGWHFSDADILETQIPDDVRQMIRHQVSQLSPEEQRLLGVASAAGVESSAALDRDVVDVEAVCERLARGGAIALLRRNITARPQPCSADLPMAWPTMTKAEGRTLAGTLMGALRPLSPQALASPS